LRRKRVEEGWCLFVALDYKLIYILNQFYPWINSKNLTQT